MTDEEKIKMLIEAIDYSFLNTQGEYDKELTYPVIDKVKFIKKSMQEEPASEDFEQAIDSYLATYFGGEKEKQNWPFLKKMAIHFVNWQKQQMIKDADDYIVDDDNTIKRFYDTGGVVGKPIIFGSTPDSINVGDHVKVIVIKEE
jgi:hypothetical protein